ncbi:MAG: L,D-transpeptidase [Phycisphaerales bacterium]
MTKHNTLLPWWLWFFVLVALGVGLWLWQVEGVPGHAHRNSQARAAGADAEHPASLPDLPPLKQAVVLIHPTAGAMQLFDGKRLVAEYPIRVDAAPAAPLRPGRAVVNHVVPPGTADANGACVLLSDTGTQPRVVAVIHAAPLPAGENPPGIRLDARQLRQFTDAIPVGAPVTILP